ncbi:unnamed protein product [Polarella glacialis]|uniref:Uncharacterized protein n=1 Tax=Polarella glacialis TaxID=89957 RepID=A0A813HBD0_POLGL|nr:unnamed protein product [Polarella glacialis]
MIERSGREYYQSEQHLSFDDTEVISKDAGGAKVAATVARLRPSILSFVLTASRFRLLDPGTWNLAQVHAAPRLRRRRGETSVELGQGNACSSQSGEWHGRQRGRAAPSQSSWRPCWAPYR